MLSANHSAPIYKTSSSDTQDKDIYTNHINHSHDTWDLYMDILKQMYQTALMEQECRMRASHRIIQKLKQHPHMHAHSHPEYLAAMKVNSPKCFIGHLSGSITYETLATQLTRRFGILKKVEIEFEKACASVEFECLQGARRAIVASLPVEQGGEGGIWIRINMETFIRLLIEPKMDWMEEDEKVKMKMNAFKVLEEWMA